MSTPPVASWQSIACALIDECVPDQYMGIATNKARVKDLFVKRSAHFDRAVTHRSASEVNNYECYETLGDAQLSALVLELLYTKYKVQTPKHLSDLKAKFVCTSVLASLCQNLGLNACIKHNLGNLTHAQSERALQNMYADVFEAFLYVMTVHLRICTPSYAYELMVDLVQNIYVRYYGSVAAMVMDHMTQQSLGSFAPRSSAATTTTSTTRRADVTAATPDVIAGWLTLSATSEEPNAPVASTTSACASLDNFKGTLQERMHKLHLGTPVYKVVGKEGPDHEPLFSVEVQRPDGTCLGTGTGHKKVDAEQSAARMALLSLRM
jgi:dsRNA-specific ribonuclease